MKKITFLLLCICFFKVQAQEPVLVKYIDSDNQDSHLRNFTECNNKTYFIAKGNELWVTDGTEVNTNMVKFVSPFYVSILAAHNNKLYLSVGGEGGEELWISDGTDAGTYSLKGGFINSLFTPISVGDKFFFKATDVVHKDEWWVTDGTSAGTQLVKDVNPGNFGQDTGTKYIAFQDKLFFYGYTEDTHRELWVSDGTEAGTYPLTSVDYPGAVLLDYDMVIYKNKLYFTFHDLQNGIELWVSDGTVEGTHLFKDTDPDNQMFPGNGWAGGFHIVNDKMLFIAYDIQGKEHLWSTDGTAENTVAIKEVGTIGGSLTDWEYMNGLLYFAGQTIAEGVELWVTDGTAEGTHIVKDIMSGGMSSNPVRLTASGNELFFYASDGTHGNELWVSDGTNAGTKMIKDIMPGATGSMGGTVSSYDMIALNGKVYFVAKIAGNDFHLFESDGTEAGTVSIHPADATVAFSPLGIGSDSIKYTAPLSISLGVIYFQAEYTNEGDGLYSLGTQVLGNDFISKTKFTMYPNPVNDILKVSVSSEDAIKSFTIYNMLGQRIQTAPIQSVEEVIEIDMSELQAGYYLIELFSSNGKTVQKVIKN